MIDGQLWYATKDNVFIYNTNLEKLSTIKLAHIGKLAELAGVKSDMVAMASNNGLFLIDKRGKSI